MKALGAVFGSVYGWERPNWFAPEGYGFAPDEVEISDPAILTRENHPPVGVGMGEKVREVWSFRRSNYFDFVGEEARNVHENVGLLDMSAFAKYEASGPGAEAWLDSILANRIPKTIGRIALCHLLTVNGGVRSEFTVYRTGRDSFYLVGPGAYERHDWDTLCKLLPASGVRLNKVTTQTGVLVLAGPRSRDVLQSLTDTDLSTANFPWLTGRFINVGIAQAHALRVNFVGELGWELHHPIEMQNVIFDQLMEAGRNSASAPSASGPWTRCGWRSPIA
jgi:dimethylglycine dehydrogenase